MLSGVTFLWLHYLVETSDVGSLRRFPGSLEGKVSTCNAGDPGSIPELGRSPGEENGNLLQYSCPENSMDRGAWWATDKELDMTELLHFPSFFLLLPY